MEKQSTTTLYAPHTPMDKTPTTIAIKAIAWPLTEMNIRVTDVLCCYSCITSTTITSVSTSATSHHRQQHHHHCRSCRPRSRRRSNHHHQNQRWDIYMMREHMKTLRHRKLMLPNTVKDMMMTFY